MVADQHQVAHLEALVDAPAGVGHHQAPGSQGVQDPHGQHDLLHGVTFVVVDAAPQDPDGTALQAPQDQGSHVAVDGGRRKPGDLREGDGDRFLDLVGQAAQARAQDQGHLGNQVGPPANGLGSPGDD